VIIDHHVTIPAPAERVWALMMDVPEVSTCVPGVERVTPAGEDAYDGVLTVKVGPIGVRLEGRVKLAEQDREAWRARMDVEATDKRIRGAVSAKATMQLTPRDDGATDLDIHADASILGKLGQFGQAVLRKKADQVMAEFANNLSKKLATG